MFKAFFDIIGTFCTIQPQSGTFFSFHSIFSKKANLSCPLAPLLKEVKICTH